MSETEFGAPDGSRLDSMIQSTNGDNGDLTAHTWADGADKLFEDSMDTVYATDFLVDRAIDFIDEQKEASRPFALFLSLPDHHGE